MKKVVEDMGDDEDFKSGSWVRATDYVNANGGIVSECLGDIKKFLNKGKLDQVVAIVKSCSPNVIVDLTVTMKDLSGTIPGTIHHKVIGDDGYRKDITATAPVDTENWISHMEKIFDVMGCEDAFKTRLAVYKFEGNALAWWKAYKQAKGGDAWLITCFLRLAGFLGTAAGTEEEQAKNFQWGLRRKSGMMAGIKVEEEIIRDLERLDIELYVRGHHGYWASLRVKIEHRQASGLLAEIFQQEIVRLHGTPSAIVSDRDLRFASRFWKGLQKAWGTRLKFSTAFRPQTDDQSERTIQTLEDMLCSCTLEWTGNWDDYICLIEFAYNNSWHASIKCAPFEMLYGRKCCAPICWDQVGERVTEGPEMIEVTNAKVTVAKEKLKEARTRQKSYADKHRRLLEFQP
nr:putative nucleotidyltransferase, ribonuclease H [Tanacetum cinerariifolium]